VAVNSASIQYEKINHHQACTPLTRARPQASEAPLTYS
jgi:hypothetical protein